MFPTVPLVFGVPGGIELVVIFFILFLLFGVPVALALLLGYRYVQGQTQDARVEELEAEIAALREKLDAIDDASSTSSTDDTAEGADE